MLPHQVEIDKEDWRHRPSLHQVLLICSGAWLYVLSTSPFLVFRVSFLCISMFDMLSTKQCTKRMNVNVQDVSSTPRF